MFEIQTRKGLISEGAGTTYAPYLAVWMISTKLTFIQYLHGWTELISDMQFGEGWFRS